MGQSSTNNAGALRVVPKAGAAEIPTGSTEKARFGMYFPRVFACAYSLSGDEATAKDVVSVAFSRVLVH